VDLAQIGRRKWIFGQGMVYDWFLVFLYLHEKLWKARIGVA
jgi:hypothetical protein